MDLESFISQIQSYRLNDSDAALRNIANSERYLQQSYEGRCLFELIQNVRDANRELNLVGNVIIELQENLLTITNTGAPFDQKGVNSITTIGDSPKESQNFIGFKGIGFKSVYEISETPKVTTAWGSILFNKEKTKELLAKNNRILNENDIPLFFIPHYTNERLSKEDVDHGFVTRIQLLLKPQINPDIILKAFEAIGVHQILLLGNLNKIIFSQIHNNTIFEIIEEPTTRKVTIKRNQDTYRFKHFKPIKKTEIPQYIIDQLEDKEKEIYKKEPFVDISLVFDIDTKDKLIKNEKSKLYLFYPTEITSGFGFIIHSYFIVNPERKALRNSPLNKFILESIADYLSNEWMNLAKKTYKHSFLDFLVFERNEEAFILNNLYDKLIINLLSQKFLFDSETQKFYRHNEVILANGFEKELFPDNELNNKRLIYIDNFKTSKWLKDELGIEYLSQESIAANIEKECQKQKGKKNIQYFINLYKYLVEHTNIDLKGKKVLLTNKMRLLSSDADVFYGFKDKIEFPESIQKRIHFINSKIKISDQRLGKGQTGFREYNTEELVKRLLKLYNDKTIPERDILYSLLKLQISDKLYSEIKQKVLLPVNSDIKWLNPLRNPIYVDSPELRNLYANNQFIDYFEIKESDIDRSQLNERLIKLGAWDIPSIYFFENSIIVTPKDERFEFLFSVKRFSTPSYRIKGDWILDTPSKLNLWFSTTIKNNWVKYSKFIEDENNPIIRFSSVSSISYPLSRDQSKYVTSFIRYLKFEKWVVPDDSGLTLTIADVVGIDPIEVIQSHSFLIKKYLRVFPFHYNSNIEFVRLLNLNHLDSGDINVFKNILGLVFQQYPDAQITDKEFVSFYNKILSKLYDLYSNQSFDKSEINQLRDIEFLGINEIEKKFEWKLANQIYYIEDKHSYEILPTEIKRVIQPHFTNRDKNKFGQIGKRIGLDFRREVEQKVTNASILNTESFANWLPELSESLGLVEVLIERNLDDKIDRIKNAVVNVCSNFDIELFKDEQNISTIHDIPYKLDNGEKNTIFVLSSDKTFKKIPYALILNDLLVEILERDLSFIRISLIDFFENTDKFSFLDKFEVSPFRVEEIKGKIYGYLLSKEQIFWLPIFLIKSINNELSYFKEEKVDFARLASDLFIDFDFLLKFKQSINFELINSISNIRPLIELFEILGISVSEYNQNSESKIDFRQFYSSQIEGIKQKAKPIFMNKLFNHLINLNYLEQSRFQEELDNYSTNPFVKINDYVLDMDIEYEFIKAFEQRYPYLSISKIELIEQWKTNFLTKLYKENEAKFRKNICNRTDYESIMNDFLEPRSNSSLLYFISSIEFLTQRFNVFYDSLSQSDIIGTNEITNLSQYVSKEGVEIEGKETSCIGNQILPKGPKDYPNGGGVDGGRHNPKKDLIGMVAEKIVYGLLSQKYNSTEWVSRNAFKARINLEGADTFGYDITYVDEFNQIQYVEVKGKVDNQNHFYISYPEYCKAIEKGENYHIIIVKNTLDNERREIIDIGNIFILDGSSDIFHNKNFTANFNILEVKFA